MFYHGSRIKLHRFCAHVAQSVEHILGKDEVTGSIPVMGSTDCGECVIENIGCDNDGWGNE